MADIRLKSLTVESRPLYIKSGNVFILDTTVSSSSIDGSFVVAGGISVNCTHESVSATSGGALTIGGGIGVSKSLLVGQNLKLENSVGLFEVSGLSTPRFKVDNVINKNITLAPNGVNTRFTFNDTTLTINSTQHSINITSGSLVTLGGVSIMSTLNSTSSSSGGALTVGGGVGITKDVNVGTKITVGENDSQVVIGEPVNTSSTGVFLDYSPELNAGILSGQTDKNILISPYSGSVGIATTNPNFTLDVNGDIGCTRFTTANIYVSNNIVAYNITAPTANFTSATIPSLFTTSMTIGNVTVSNITSNNLSMNDASITTLSSSNIMSTNITMTSLIGVNISSGNGTITNLRATGATITNFNVANISSSSLRVSNNTILTNTSISNLSNTNLSNTNFTNTNILTSNITTSSLNITSNSGLRVGPGGDSGAFYTTYNDFGIANGEVWVVEDLDDTVGCSFYQSSTGQYTTLFSKNNDFGILNYTGGTGGTASIDFTIKPNGNVGIGTTTPSFKLDVNGSGNFNTFITSGAIYSNNQTTTNIVTTNLTSASLIATTGITASTARITNGVITNLTTTNIINTNTTSSNLFVSNNTVNNLLVTGSLRATFYTNTIGSIITTGGNVGIGTSSPETTLHISGTMRVAQGVASNSYSFTSDSGGGGPRVNFGTLGTSNQFMELGAYSNVNNIDSKNRTFHIFNNMNTILYSSTTGNIGINTTNPTTTLDVNGTVDSTALGNGTFIVNGGSSISRNLNLGGKLQIYSTTDSSDVSSGALIVSGGVGVGKNLNVLGNTIIAGNLTVQGTSTIIETTNTNLKDNIIVLNAGPAGSRDSGFIITRYQLDNNVGDGDVVNDVLSTVFRLGDQTGMTSNQVKLPPDASVTDNYYTNWWIKVTSGFSNDQVRKITSYNGSTKIATLSSAWTSQNPANNDYISVYNKPFVGLFYNEINDVFVFGSTVGDPGQTNVAFTDNLPIQFLKATSVSTDASTNLSSGALMLSGGVTINCSQDSSSLTAGGSITTTGGASIGKTLRTKDLYVNGVQFTPNSGDILTTQTFIATNNQSSFADITGLVFAANITGVDIYLTTKITATSNLATNFHIRGINRGSSWEIVKTYVGDDIGIEFNMTNSGQLQYTTQNYTGATQILFKYKAFTN